jgi:thiamine phosphate synthase YjbQ (UPF0047 family)
MTSVEIPYSVAAALPSLVVLDITNEVRREVERADVDHGIVFVSAGDEGLVRVNEREAGFFDDVERMLSRLVPVESVAERERLLSLLLGPRTEQVPFAERRLCLGRWQRILLFSFDEESPPEWTLTVVG